MKPSRYYHHRYTDGTDHGFLCLGQIKEPKTRAVDRWVSVVVRLWLLSALGGCDLSVPEEGGLGQPCYKGGLCEPTLICVSDRCVECQPEDKSCIDNTSIAVCQDGRWIPGDDCTQSGQFCQGGACVSGPCLDSDGNFQPSDWECDHWTEYHCTSAVCGAAAQQREVTQFCSGQSPSCNGSLLKADWEDLEYCDQYNQVCLADGETPAECTICPAGQTCCNGNCALSSEVCWEPIPAGTFMMGSQDPDAVTEQPVHQVAVPTFDLSRTEVTVGQYRACVNAGGCTPPATEAGCTWKEDDSRNDYPINCLLWSQADEFCRWAGGRLPSEAEWEYAARSLGQDIAYPWGNETPTCDYTVMEDCGGSGGRPHPVCSRPAGHTAQGLCDMAGNVWELVQDCWHASYDDAPTDGSAWEDGPSSDYRVRRGGSHHDIDVKLLRVTTRGGYNIDDSGKHVGFRCARSQKN